MALACVPKWCHNGTMNLALYVETLREHLLALAQGDPETGAVVDRIVPGIEAATRMVLLETLSAAADEITRELAPGSVEIRLRGTDPEFAVALPPGDTETRATPAPPTLDATEEGGIARLNLRLPESLKVKVEEAARREGLSLNTWLVRAAAAAVEGTQGSTIRRSGGSERYTGWVR